MKPQYLAIFLIFSFSCNDKDDDAISEIKVEQISITGTDIQNGKTSTMVAAIMPENATNKDVTWSVSDETIAVISATGILTANNNGTVTVKATAADGSGVVATKQISITGFIITVSQITVSGNDITTGASTQMTAVVAPSTAANQNVTWTVSDITIASISESGMLTVKNNGNVMVTATAKDGSGVSGTKTISVSSFLDLNRVDVFLEKGTNVTGNVTVQIQNANGEILGTAVTPASNITGSTWHSFNFLPSLIILPGLKYLLVITRSVGTSGPGDYIAWRTSSNGDDLYTQGISSAGLGWTLDFAFRTYSNNKIDQQQTSTNYGFSISTSPTWQEFVPTKK